MLRGAPFSFAKSATEVIAGHWCRSAAAWAIVVTPSPQDVAMDKSALDIHIREEDPLFGRALELGNEVVAALVYGVWEPSSDGTAALPTLSAAVNEINDHPDPALLCMFVFAIGRCARNLALTVAHDRRWDLEDVLQEFLLRPMQ